MRVAAIILAAGRGERFGADVPKAFVPLAGRSLIERSIVTLASLPEVQCVQPVVARCEIERYRAPVGGVPDGKLRPPIPGGVERQDSVAAGVAAIGEDIDLVAIHDAARCLVSEKDVRAVIEAAARTGAALLATPATDTIKRACDGRVVETPPRTECWIAQTPQVFRLPLLRAALERAARDGIQGTDDAELVERLGEPVSIVEGDPANIKITLPEDLARAEWLLAQGRGGGR